MTQLASLAVATLALLTSAASFYVSYDANRRTYATQTRTIMQDFLAEARQNDRSSECISFANQIEPDAFNILFADNATEFSYANRGADGALNRCFGKAPATAGHLSSDEAFQVRKNIFSKLNAFEAVYLAISQDEANADVLCSNMQVPFRQHAHTFLQNARNSTNRPVELQNVEKEYQYSLMALDGKICASR